MTTHRLKFNARDFSISLGKKTKLMGIVNVTCDSFSGDGVLKERDFTDAAFRLAMRQINSGADFIDIGGESSRQGAKMIPALEEIKRIIPVITKLAKATQIPISVDTYKSKTAKYALDAGASIINNIRGTSTEKGLLKMAAKYNAGIILMHMRGTAITMQKKSNYDNLIPDIIKELKTAIENCLENGIKSDNIIIDPGIGFAKTTQQNLAILDHLQEFKVFKRPIMVGTSRKSFIGGIINQVPKKRLAGTIASCVIAVANGAHLLRVHDVKPLAQAIAVTDAIIKSC